jgi:hypothetical protein
LRDGCFVGYINRRCDDPVDNLRRGLLGAGEVDIGCDYPRARFGEGDAHGTADAGAGSGHQTDSIFEPAAHGHPFRPGPLGSDEPRYNRTTMSG